MASRLVLCGSSVYVQKKSLYFFSNAASESASVAGCSAAVAWPSPSALVVDRVFLFAVVVTVVVKLEGAIVLGKCSQPLLVRELWTSASSIVWMRKSTAGHYGGVATTSGSFIGQLARTPPRIRGRRGLVAVRNVAKYTAVRQALVCKLPSENAVFLTFVLIYYLIRLMQAS
jgi:hypothetical protein